jgi:hypothetical protein
MAGGYNCRPLTGSPFRMLMMRGEVGWSPAMAVVICVRQRTVFLEGLLRKPRERE